VLKLEGDSVVKTLKPGDRLMFTQEDGNMIVIVVSPTVIGVKAENPGTELIVDRCNNFTVMIKAANINNKT
jgi:hypothetical protein